MTPSIRALLLAAPLLAGAGAGRAEGAQFTIAPPPAWVTPLAADLARPARPDTEGGVEYLVVDDQVRVGPGEQQAYRRLVTRVTSTKGIQDGSDVRIDFDPQYERLVLHGVTILRGGARIPALRAPDVKVIQREPELDEAGHGHVAGNAGAAVDVEGFHACSRFIRAAA